MASEPRELPVVNYGNTRTDGEAVAATTDEVGKATERQETCGNCRAYAGSPYDEAGECRRRAPVVDHTAAASASWPVVLEGDFCCEWLPAESPR